jgi:ribosomal protein L24
MDKKVNEKRPRMVVEEVEKSEVPQKESPKPDILEEGAKVSSEELKVHNNIQLVEDKEQENTESKVDKSEEFPTPPQSIEKAPNTPPATKKSSSIALWIIIPGIFLLGALLGGIYFYEKGASALKETSTPTPVPTPVTLEATPSASPSPQVDLSKYQIAVFNGSGVSGAAGDAKTLLTNAGFSVSKTGNAATYDYTKTIIKAQASVDPSFIIALSNILSKKYVVDTPQPLSSSSADMVEVIIGSTKAQ